MLTSNKPFDVAIAGAGPAGTSAAIQLALAGGRVLLIEEKKFPRAKLCGEFISPECFMHFKRLGVIDQMFSAGGASISETVFYTRRGQSVGVPSEWFKSGTHALGLSRSEMDYQLLERAKSVGVVVLEGAHAAGLIKDRGRVRGLRVKTAEIVNDYPALITIDATGRTRALTRHLDHSLSNQRKKTQRSLVAFKAHLKNARVAGGACEIYFYRGGYGGLSAVEGGLTNLCFIVSAEDVRNHDCDPETVMREIVMKNSRAAYTLADAHPATPWLSVSLEGFGRQSLSPVCGLLTIGDAAAFIDPFTGSGMLMALESGEVVAKIILRHLSRLRESESFALLSKQYQAEYSRRFHSRLHIAGLLRGAAFVPGLAEAAILFFGTSSYLRRKLARATRDSTTREVTTTTG